ncbi:hypothetical protein LTR97_012378 [Elasticomyces elasticus]|uniref:Uncharacterized protein n=1 Tax=Elasticomyces elasticus TaxID=574655 RepID=A0AAN7VVR0_9PEZI|nr:hypothetical protein LTR97_012378 [Elasticomyces elasticus]
MDSASSHDTEQQYMEPTSPAGSLEDTRPREKLRVIQALNIHLAHGVIEQRTHDKLYRMIEIISAVGLDLRRISKIPHASFIRRVEWARKAHEAADALTDLDGVDDDKHLTERLKHWREILCTLHVPTGNDARLFQLVYDHYDDTVYSVIIQLHRTDPEIAIWKVNPKLTAVSQCLDEVRTLCNTADGIVEQLEVEYAAASKRVLQLTMPDTDPVVEAAPQQRPESLILGSASGDMNRCCRPDDATASEQPPHSTVHSVRLSASSRPADALSRESSSRPDLRIDVVAAEHVGLKTSPISHDPPRLPPLPFQRSDTEENLLMYLPLKSAPILDGDRSLSLVKSFGAVEELVHHRKHLRSATTADTGYTTSSGNLGLETSRSFGRPIYGDPAIGSRPKGSVSSMPRVFVKSFIELEHDADQLELRQIETPQAQPSTPRPASPTYEGDSPIKVRDFGDSSNDTSKCPSPATLLYRREALVDPDLPYGERSMYEEMIRSRRGSEEGLVENMTMLREHSRSFDSCLSWAPPIERSSPGTPSSSIRRGLLRQRDHTM